MCFLSYLISKYQVTPLGWTHRPSHVIKMFEKYVIQNVIMFCFSMEVMEQND